MRSATAALTALVCVFLATTAAASTTGVRITGVDTSELPTIRFTVVTPQPSDVPPSLTENGEAIYGASAENLGRAKSVVLAVDRSRSMNGKPLADAVTAAQAFMAAKPRADRIAIVTFATKPVLLTDFSTATIDAESALRTIDVDAVQGTTLYDGLALSAREIAAEPLQGRVIVVVTDGNETRSTASLEDAIAAAQKANAAVYVVAIESEKFTPEPLRKLAADTGGRYYAAASSDALREIYASIAAELKRTWRVSYYSSAREGDEFALRATVPAFGSGTTQVQIPGGGGGVSADPVALVPDFVFEQRIGAALVTLLVGFFVLVAASLALTTPGGTRLRRRIDPHVGDVTRRAAVDTSARDKLAAAEGMLSATERAFGHLKIWVKLERLIERADVPLRAVEVFYMSVGGAFLLGLIAAVSAMQTLVIVGVMAFGAAVPVVVLWWKAKRRLNEIENSLPDLLITMAASLKAGHSFRQGIQSVVEEGQGPASKEFDRVLTETRLGRPMDDALDEMAQRVGSKNLNFVITAVTIQRQVGGSLAGIFDMVAEAVRDRQQFARKIKSLTAMGRMSAYVLVGLPFFIAAAVTLINKEYMDPLYHSPTGHKMMAAGVVMILIGSVLLKKIVSFKG